MPYIFTPQVFIELIHVYSLSFLSTEKFSFSKLYAGLACYIFKTDSERHIFMCVCHNIKKCHGAQRKKHKCRPEEAGKNKSVDG